MWRPWGKSSSKKSDNNHHTSTTTTSSPNHQSSHHFRCTSFKDIENLCNFDTTITTNNNNDFTSSSSPLKRQPSAPLRSIFHRVLTANSLLRQWPNPSLTPDPDPKPEPTPKQTPPSPESRIVVYYTSLRVVRPTFEACRSVMSILQGFRVAIDERDLAMDLAFLSELRELLGLKLTEELTLPRVFIGGRYIGGAEEIKQLHEIGELKKLVSGIPPKKPGTCGTCGGYRFILCGECSGSHKIFSEKVGFRCCLTCNENGLIRCPSCSSPPLIRPILAPINGC